MARENRSEISGVCEAIDLLSKRPQTLYRKAQAGGQMPGGESVRIAKLVLLCGLVMAVAASKASADTRDDVLSAISRCNVIHDNKVWLDCVYGAQQPMRALLGLPPAPEYQQRLVPSPGVLPQPAVIAPPPAPVSAAPA